MGKIQAKSIFRLVPLIGDLGRFLWAFTLKNRKRSGYVDCQQVRSIDRNLFFSKLRLLILRQ